MENNIKQTALEWFAERIQSDKIFNFEKVYEKAKEMEKEQIIEAFEIGVQSEFFLQTFNAPSNDGEKYYNETYGGGEQ
jgi:hypothetical protein